MQGRVVGWPPIVEARKAVVPTVPTRLIYEELARHEADERRAERERQARTGRTTLRTYGRVRQHLGARLTPNARRPLKEAPIADTIFA